MSGAKDTIVNLRRSEYDRLMRNCREVDGLKQSVGKRVRSAEGRVRNRLEKRLRDSNSRHRKYVNRVSGQVRDLERDMHRTQRQASQEFDRKLKDLRQATDQRMDAELGALEDRVGRQVDAKVGQLREETRRDLTAVARYAVDLRADMEKVQQEFENRVSTLETTRSSARDSAARWCRDTTELLRYIGDSFDHAKFRPGAVEQLRQQLRLAEGNRERGLDQAAVAGAQQAWLAAQTLRGQLEADEAEWQAMLQVACTSAARSHALCTPETPVQFAFGSEQGELVLDVNLDFWVDGGLSELTTRAEAETKLLQDPAPLSLGDLQQSVDHSLQIERERAALVERAKEALVASQLRSEMAEGMVGALADMGWYVMDATYEGEDQRRALHVKLANPAGDQVVLASVPQEDGETISNRLETHFFDVSTNDDRIRERRLGMVLATLGESGFDAGTTTTLPGTDGRSSSETSRLDFDRVRQMKPGALAAESHPHGE